MIRHPEEKKFKGNEEEYYDPNNSCLDKVRRLLGLDADICRP